MTNATNRLKKAGVLLGAACAVGVVWAAAASRENESSDLISVVSGPLTAKASPALAGTVPKAAGSTVISASAAEPIVDPVPYVLGKMTWYWASSAPPAKHDQITASMNWTLNQLNTLAGYSGNVRTVYSAGTPTADATFLGQIRFGGQTNRRTALHEMGHWLGSGGIAQFRRLVSNGAFTGAITNLRARGYDGSTARIGSDGTHFWPYGMNYDSEFREAQRTVGMVAAQRADMGMGDGTYAIVGNRRFQNRSSRMILDAGSGGAATQQLNGLSSTQVWKAGYVDGFVILVTSSADLALDSLGATTNGESTGLRSISPSMFQHWEMIPTDDGWFMLRNRATGKCLDNGGNQNVGAVLTSWSCNSNVNQQWHLVY